MFVRFCCKLVIVLRRQFMSKLAYLGHASFLIKGNELSLVIDPYRQGSVPNLTFPKVEAVDAAFSSHDHYDHDALNKVTIKDNPKPIKPVTAVVPHDHENGAKRGLNKIHMFEIDGYKIVHLGDTGCVLNEKVLDPFKNCDILLGPINGFFTISPDELKAIADIIKPRILIPMHYYMKEYRSGYEDGNMIDRFKNIYPSYQYVDGPELDLDRYKIYQGVLLFNEYLQ